MPPWASVTHFPFASTDPVWAALAGSAIKLNANTIATRTPRRLILAPLAPLVDRLESAITYTDEHADVLGDTRRYERQDSAIMSRWPGDEGRT